VKRRYSEIEVFDSKFYKRVISFDRIDAYRIYFIEKNSTLILQQLIPNNTPILIEYRDDDCLLVFEYLDGMFDLRNILINEDLVTISRLISEVLKLLYVMELHSLSLFQEYRSFDGFELRNLGLDHGRIVFFDPHNYSVACVEKDIARLLVSYVMIYWPIVWLDLRGLREFKKVLSNFTYNEIALNHYLILILEERRRHALFDRSFVIKLYLHFVFKLYKLIVRIVLF
jgi:hypothetical protein